MASEGMVCLIEDEELAAIQPKESMVDNGLTQDLCGTHDDLVLPHSSPVLLSPLDTIAQLLCDSEHLDGRLVPDIVCLLADQRSYIDNDHGKALRLIGEEMV